MRRVTKCPTFPGHILHFNLVPGRLSGNNVKMSYIKDIFIYLFIYFIYLFIHLFISFLTKILTAFGLSDHSITDSCQEVHATSVRSQFWGVNISGAEYVVCGSLSMTGMAKESIAIYRSFVGAWFVNRDFLLIYIYMYIYNRPLI